jgi:hypothetical protein
MPRVFFISTVNSRSKKKKKRSLFCAALVAGTISKLEQSILTPSISMVRSHNCLLTTAKTSKIIMGWEAKYWRRKPSSYLARIFNFKLGSLTDNTINPLNANGHFYSWKLGPGFILLAEVCPWMGSLPWRAAHWRRGRRWQWRRIRPEA